MNLINVITVLCTLQFTAFFFFKYTKERTRSISGMHFSYITTQCNYHVFMIFSTSYLISSRRDLVRRVDDGFSIALF